MRRRADVAKAEAACREFLKENPRDPEPWWRLARLHAAVDRHATAMDDARRALEIDGRCVPAAVELILAWLRTEGEHFRDRLLRAVPLSPLGGLLVRRDAAEFLPFPSVELPKNRLQALQPADFAADGSDVDALLLAGLRLAMRIRDSKSQNDALVALADRGSDRPEVYEVASLFVPGRSASASPRGRCS